MVIDTSKVTHIIFDWDGTIMDSAAKIVSCMQEAAASSNLPVPTTAQVEHIIGISLLPAIEKLFDVDSEKAKQVCKYYKDAFLRQDQISCALFDGAYEVLATLSKHYILGVATGKARRGLARAFANTSTEGYFDQSICGDEAESKPSPDMLEQLLNRWDIEAHQALMIGDTIYDMQMAEQLFMPRIAVSYGVHDKQALVAHHPLAVIDKLSELNAIFRLSGKS